MDTHFFELFSVAPPAPELLERMVRKKKSKGLLRTTRTFLEMRSPPQPPTPPVPLANLAIVRAERPTISFYRYLYNTVGESWNWTSRRQLDDDALRAVIHDPRVDIYVPYVAGVPAGFVEFVVRREGKCEVEIAFLGVIPEFAGRRLGSYLLHWAVSTSWKQEPERVWLDTCTLDHPHALAMYRRAGFVPYKCRVETVVPMDAL